MGGFAWVTLATNDSYSLGALVLAHSLKRVGTKHDLAVLVTPGVTGPMREKLSSVFTLVKEVNVLDSKDEANLALLARPELGITFTKLHCWRLTQYEKCVFVDADTLVMRNCDELFEREELSAAPDVGWPDCFNTGVYVYKPSQQTFASLTAFAAAKGSFDGGDQGLLNQYFSDWSQKDISKHLPFTYNVCSTATYSYLPAFKQFGENVRIIHFIGSTKPWLQHFDTLTGQVHPSTGSYHLQPLLQQWWDIFCEKVHHDLTPAMASSTLAQHWHEYNSNPSLSQQSSRINSNNDNNYDDTTHETVIEADFSEFHDPWESYRQSSNITSKNSYETVNIVQNNDNHCGNDNKRDNIVSNDSSVTHDCTKVVDKANNYEHENQRIFSVLEKMGHIEKQYDDNRTNHENVNYQVYPLENSCQTDNTTNWEIFFQNYEKQNTSNSQDYNCQRINDMSTCQEIERKICNRHEQELHGESEKEIFEKISKSLLNLKNNDDDRFKERFILNYNENSTDTSQYDPHVPCTKSKSITMQSETNITRQLEINDSGLAGALAKVTLGKARTAEQLALEEHMRKLSWEQGQIDYMGRDSFDNIWKKISVTMGGEGSPTSKLDSEPQFYLSDSTRSSEIELAAKSGAAVLSEPQQKDPITELAEVKNLLATTITELTPLKMTSESPPLSPESIALTDPAKTTEVAQVTKIPELIESESHETSSSTSSSKNDQTQTSTIEDKIDENILETRKDLEIEPSSSSIEATIAQIVIDNPQVPIQVAVSILEAEVKESVTEDLRPVTEEAVSTISLNAQVSVPAVLETAMEAIDPIVPESNGNVDGHSEIGNGIDAAPGLSSPAAVTSATVAIVQGHVEVLPSHDILVSSQESASHEEDSLPVEVLEESVSKLEPQEPLKEAAETSLEQLDSQIQKIDPKLVVSEQKPQEPAKEAAETSLELSDSQTQKTEPISVVSQQKPEEPPKEAAETSLEQLDSQTQKAEAKLVVSQQKPEEPPKGAAETSLEQLDSPTQKADAKLVVSEQKLEEPSKEAAETSLEQSDSETPKTDAKSVVSEHKPQEPSKEAAETSLEQLDSQMNKTDPPSVVSEQKLQEPSKESAETVQKPSDSQTIQKKPKQTDPAPAVPEQKSQELLSSQTPRKTDPTPVVSSAKPQETSAKSDETKIPVKPSKSSVPTPLKIEKSLTQDIIGDPPISCPSKKVQTPPVNKKTTLPTDSTVELSTIGKEVSVDSRLDKDEISESSEESTSSNASRIKELQIPDTPTITEATPPTSPPIDGAITQSLEDQPAKPTKKIVKRVVKKTVETKSTDTSEPDVDGKKVTKKIVKKIVKKKIDDDAAQGGVESTSGNEKTKKIVKIVKKTTKTAQTLDTEANVPETPPPGGSSTTEVAPVPPKRKLKTTNKTITTSLKSDSEP